jgi:D-hydroxyproline dehydrogenase subunit beta
LGSPALTSTTRDIDDHVNRVSENVVVIGSGIIGLAHAITAREAGYAVTLIERQTRPLGASIRNFGSIWPIGLAFGPLRDQALYGVERWRELSTLAGFWMDPRGSLCLAHSSPAWKVLEEFSNIPEAVEARFELLSSNETLKRYPLVNPDELRGALFSPHETCIRSAEAMTALIAYARTLGITFEFGACAIKVNDSAVEVSDGRTFVFDRCVIAAGEDMRLLFPRELSRANLRPCQLQMMRSAPISSELGAMMVGDLTLVHYPAFSKCPSVTKLRNDIHERMSAFEKWGVHVMAAQNADGSLVLGDSHEYGDDFAPDHWTHVDDLVLDALARFIRIPHLRIDSRWNGVYLKSTIGETQVILQPRERVTMVTAMGGLGMTLCWGLAQKTVASWSERNAPR